VSDRERDDETFEGGDPPCWSHLLGDDGGLGAGRVVTESDRPTQADEATRGAVEPAAEARPSPG
jgi:hypothetical protein